MATSWSESLYSSSQSGESPVSSDRVPLLLVMTSLMRMVCVFRLPEEPLLVR